MKKTSMFQEFEETFKNPGKEFRGTPFWSWNTKLDADCLEKQIEQFKEMGMGGFYMHTRVGLDTEYMGKEYMECIKKAVQIAKEKDLYSCLYDEDRWPSGYGGGKVTVHPQYRSRNILITTYKKGTKTYDHRSADSMASSSPQGNGRFLAAYYVRLNTDGTLASYERCDENAKACPGAKIWYAYLEIAHDSPWFNNQSYVDSLNPEAIRYFIEVTHEAYKKAVGEEFGQTIPSVFTDEPQFGRKKFLGTAESKEEVMLPFTDDFAKSYKKTYGEDLLDHIPELLWELPNEKVSKYRYWYHDHVTERFAEAFSDQVGNWCKENGIRLAGHMMEEPTLQSQTQALGEVMRSLRGFSLPGIDMLCDAREYTTAKQAESVCHQYGKEGVASELYGVTNWDFDFRRHKLQGDWQAALGITHRVHHLNWMSMGGEAKRDYPAAIGFQSPWYKEYGIIETHFARVNTALRKGTPLVKIGVIHPVESCWILFGPNQQTGQKRQELDRRFADVTEWLLFNNLDFDYISESLLPEEWDGRKVGKMEYDAIVVPGCLTLRGTTLSILEEMKKAGKKIVFMGKAPQYIDACRSIAGEEFASRCTQIGFSKLELLTELEPYRLLDIRFHGEKHLKKPNHKKNWNGERTEKYLYQMRQEENGRWLFIANGRAQDNPDLILPDDVKIELAGSWKVTEFDTMTGDKREVEAEVCKDKTVLYRRFFEHDSLLLYLEPAEEAETTTSTGRDICRGSENGKEKNYYTTEGKDWEAKDLFASPVKIEREEPNVLVLDMPRYCFDGKTLEGPEEILRADNRLRTLLHLPLRRAALAQPWTQKKEEKPYKIMLQYEIFCQDAVKDIQLGLEALKESRIWLDKEEISKKETGYFVDPCIHTIALPALKEGLHELKLEVEFTGKVNLESMYLLGDFSVQVTGSRAVLKKERESFFWGSLTEQGMSFYGGNAVYKTEIDLEQGSYILEVSKFRAPLLKVRVDGKDVGEIFKAPYRAAFETTSPGKHLIEIISYGNRVNTFGAIHDCDEQEIYFDPNAWRTTLDSWSYEYQLKKTGILKAPILWKQK
ncbi:hypothetical protein H8S37_15665 [Mediterraneibacter sp. NSJ-55]|uniref:Glycoside hydrolase n=1 Tax=Mediterraneibacter hominis TaxID=2763054 RepID=A0A923LM01_9FIRM|nr:glycosyl hydrolase [Mediterraneibacter hominis]MBC5690354.1 hypothetical protein [Mediterraneibacter hominis]